MEQRQGIDRRMLVALLVAFATLQLWFWWFSPPEPEPESAEPVASSPGTPPVAAPAGEPPAPVAVPSSDLPARELALEFCNIDAKLDTEGGVLKSVALTDWHASYHAEPVWSWVWSRLQGKAGAWRPYDLDSGYETVLSDDSQMLAMGSGQVGDPAPRVAVVEESAQSAVLRGVTPEGIEVTRALRVLEDCTLDVELTWKNVSDKVYNGALWMSAHDRLSGEAGRYANVARPIGMVGGSVERWPDLDDLEEPARYEGAVDWFGLADHYFAAFVIPAGNPRGTLIYSPVRTGDGTLYGEHYVVETALAPGEAVNERFRLYLGTMELDRLREIDTRLTDAVNLGWFGFFGRILLWLLKVFHSVIGNWGVAIICLTVLVKVLFYPLTQMSFKSGQAMQALQPKLQEIREKFADNQEELNRRTMELFRENGVNPVGGCLPTLVQMPIWIALYNVLLNSVELYQTEFLYLKDLSSVDPYAVMPLLVVVLMWAQQQMMPMGNMDPAQQRIMKLMPLILGVFFFTSPSGLTVYIFVNMVLTILQQWLVKRTVAAAAAQA